MSMIETLSEQIRSTTLLEWLAVVTALIYVGLAARNRVICFVFGAISGAIWAYVSFFRYDLYMDAFLQLFYVAMSFYGIYRWKFGGTGAEKPISRTTRREHGTVFGIGVPLSILCAELLSNYTQAAATYLDSFTTVFSLLATWLLVERKLENWLYWIVLDAIYVGLYASREAYLFAVLMVLYTIIAAVAYLRWRRIGSVIRANAEI